MTVEYEVTGEDYIFWHVVYCRHSETGEKVAENKRKVKEKLFSRMMLIDLSVVALSLLMVLSGRWHPVPGFNRAIMIVLGILLLIAVSWILIVFHGQRFVEWLIQREAANKLKKAEPGSLTGPERLTLKDDCIENADARQTTLFPYPSIYRIGVGYDHVYLYTSPQSAHLIPVAAFGGQARMDEFLETLCQKTGLPVTVWENTDQRGKGDLKK